ncbi:30S ribosomal protein S16 [Buchnera aphidicola (Tetraneura ulmi)]|uniref:30S ribosomal protein S16 n=1 Tax=Buchnera aphidicola TaxID=9 RepID=UPI003464DC08
MVKIRLARHGSKKKPFYKIVIADNRFFRNGRFIEKIGFFNPIEKDNSKKLSVNLNNLKKWIRKGAQMSQKIKFLIKKLKK